MRVETTMTSLRERFFAKVDKNGPVPAHCPELGPCWIWRASRRVKRGGYGQFRVGGKMRPASRVAFFLAHGRWPEPERCHHCDNPSCVNAAHLFEGTHQDNMRDMAAKGRRAPELSAGRPGSRNSAAKLTEQEVINMRYEYALGGVTQDELATRHGIRQQSVSKILRGQRWTHLSGAAP